MLLYTTSAWYNPYHVDIETEKNLKSYRINDIHIFNKDGVVISSGRGWVGHGNNTVPSVTLPCDCVVKRSTQYEKMYKERKAFISNFSDKNVGELYIPDTIVNIVSTRDSKSMKHLCRTYTTNIDGWEFYEDISLDIHLLHIRCKISEIGDHLISSYGDDNNILSEIDRNLAELKELRDEYAKEIEWIKSIKETDFDKLKHDINFFNKISQN